MFEDTTDIDKRRLAEVRDIDREIEKGNFVGCYCGQCVFLYWQREYYHGIFYNEDR